MRYIFLTGHTETAVYKRANANAPAVDSLMLDCLSSWKKQDAEATKDCIGRPAKENLVP